MTNPKYAGPDTDGSKSLAPESRVGNIVQWFVTAGATGLLSALVGLNTSHWSGYIGMVGVSVVGLAIGLLTSWLKKNR